MTSSRHCRQMLVSTFIVALLLLLSLQLQTSKLSATVTLLLGLEDCTPCNDDNKEWCDHCCPAFARAAKRGRFSPVRHDDDMILD